MSWHDTSALSASCSAGRQPQQAVGAGRSCASLDWLLDTSRQPADSVHCVSVQCAGHKNAVLEVQWTTDGERVLSASPDK